MTNPIVDDQLRVLAAICPGSRSEPIGGGGDLIIIPNYNLPPGWSAKVVTILFVAPAGYPAAQPDCFWVEPTGLRLENGTTPLNTNDSNPIPGIGPRGTWFSWHVQQWNANHDSLVTYLSVIKQRLSPAR